MPVQEEGGRLRVFTGRRCPCSLEEAGVTVLSLRTGIIDSVETELDTVRVFHEGTRPRALRLCSYGGRR